MIKIIANGAYAASFPLISFLANSSMESRTWICQSCYTDFFKLLHGFIKADTWISLSCDLDLSKLIH